MAAQKSVSFRSPLYSHATDLIEEMGVKCAGTARLISGVVSRLAAYTEEGISLSPTVYVCNSINDLLRRAGTGEYVSLGRELKLESAAGAVLKAAAPLCTRLWHVYVERSDGSADCSFGIFCGSSDPSSLSVEEVLLADYEPGFPVVRIAQSATNKVEVKTSAGSSVEFRFNDDNDVATLDAGAHLSNLAASMCSDLDANREVFAGFLERVLHSAVVESHGTLIAVLPHSSENVPEALADCVPLSPPIDLFDRFQRHAEEGMTAASVSRLQTATDLVAGIVRSDGITIFDSAGRVRGYRAFVRSDGAQPAAAGGARTRAFQALRQMLGSDLVAAFFRSQDGRTEIATKGTA